VVRLSVIHRLGAGVCLLLAVLATYDVMSALV
jgi:hypothetical protein